MSAVTSFPRRLAFALVTTGLLGMLIPGFATAQMNVPTLYLRPHCDNPDQTACPAFEATDPTMLMTPLLAPEQTLDVDLVLSNPGKESIAKIRVWLSYDAEALEGKTVVISPVFPVVIPGESDFAPLSGYAKIAASAQPGNEPDDEILPIARLTFTVQPAASIGMTPLSFYDQSSDAQGHTSISTVISPAQNLLAAPLGTLIVQIETPATLPSPGLPTPLVDTVRTGTGSSSPALFPDPETGTPPPFMNAPTAPVVSVDGQSSFSLIQLQSLRLGTRDNILYVTWDLLNHPKLQGYNVYFGATKGRYLQRRSVSLASRGAVIRDLPKGKTYYVAVRGVDDENRETAFSSEESVEIGNPVTSTSPILGALEAIGEESPQVIAPENPVEYVQTPLTAGVPGKAGSSSGLVLLLIGSAVIGTFLAGRRQFLATHTLPV